MPTHHPSLLVILPALNEAGNIAKTISAIRQQLPFADIVVIDDGSDDNTRNEASDAGAIVLHMPYNVGIGAAVQTGFRFAARYQYDFVMRNDGDGQHHPAALQQMFARIQDNTVDMVIGSRFLQNGDYGTSLPRRAGITILSRLLSFITKQAITDPTSGYAAFNRDAILLFAQLYPHDYPEPEAIVLLHRSGLQLCEIPVTMQAREYGKSSITPMRSAYYMVKVILAILINLLRRAPVIQQS
ncbi:MAG: glycosyltransferase family 2 protein [Aggregatilineales bacterium]